MRRPDVFTLDYSHPLAQGLQFAGLMQNPGSIVVQDALLRNNLQLVNMEMSDWSSDDAGRVSLKFGGTDERAETSAYVVQPFNAGYSEFPTLGVAMSVWFRPSSVATNQTIFCLGGYNSYRRARFRFLGEVTGDPVSFEHKGSVAVAELVSASGLNGDTQTWHHLYAYFRNTYREFWLDGRFVGSNNSSAGSGSTNSPLCLGCFGYATTRAEFFTGELADPLVWVREINPLSPAEIAILADRTDPMLGGLIVEERPVLYFDMGGSVPTDITGTMSVTETGQDTLAATGQLLISGLMSVSESGVDTASILGVLPVQGALSATETGQDTFAAYGGAIAPITGTMAVTESGNDTATIVGQLLISGLMDVSEVGDDVFAALGEVTISGSMLVSEIGDDIFYATGASLPTIYGSMAVNEEGLDTLLASGFVWTNTINKKILYANINKKILYANINNNTLYGNI